MKKRLKVRDKNVGFAITMISEAYRILEKNHYREAAIIEWLHDYIAEKYALVRTCPICGAKISEQANGPISMNCPKCGADRRAAAEAVNSPSKGNVRIDRGTVVGDSGVADFIDYLDEFKNGAAQDQITALRIMSATGDHDEVESICGSEKIWIKDTLGTRPETLKRIAEREYNDRVGNELWLKMQDEQRKKNELAKRSQGQDGSQAVVVPAKDFCGSRACVNCRHKHRSASMVDGVLCKITLRKKNFGDCCERFDFE